MTIEEQRNYIKEKKEYVIKTLNAALDTLYNIMEAMVIAKENAEKRGDLVEADLIAAYAEQKNNTEQFEKVRRKIIDEDFNLSLLEINQTILAAMFCEQVLRDDVEKRLKLIEECSQFQYDLGIFNEMTQV